MPLLLHVSRNHNEWWRTDDVLKKQILGLDEICAAANSITREQAMEQCIERCARNKVIHMDIAWRHVALYPIVEDGRVRVDFAFMDLGRIAVAESEDAATAQMNEAVGELGN